MKRLALALAAFAIVGLSTSLVRADTPAPTDKPLSTGVQHALLNTGSPQTDLQQVYGWRHGYYRGYYPYYGGYGWYRPYYGYYGGYYPYYGGYRGYRPYYGYYGGYRPYYRGYWWY